MGPTRPSDERVRSTAPRIRLTVALVTGLIAVLALGTLAGRSGEGGSRTQPTPTTAAGTGSTIVSSTTTTTAPTTLTVSTTAAPATTAAPTTATPPAEAAIAIRRVETTAPVVALTFDAGSDVGWAAEILDTLAANGIDATFGMTGRWAEANPALVRRMVAEGHQLVNHSYDHPSFTGRSTGAAPLSAEQRRDQLARAEAAVQAATGTSMAPWFRPPYGDDDASVRRDVAAAGYRYELLWTVDSLGWKGITPDAVVRRCLDGALPGAIYLFHVGAASTDHAALQQIIDGLRAAGYGFATAADLLDA